MSLTELALKNKLSTYLLVALMCVFGVMSYLSAEKAEDPGYTVKTAIITTKWPGATAEQVAELVSKKIEQEVRTLDSLDYVYSKNTPGESNVYVNLKAKYWETFEPFQELMNKVNSFVVLPPDASKPIINVYFGNVYGTVLTMQSDTVSPEKLYEYSEDLKKELFFNVPEIAEVKIYGRQNEMIYID
ncbi:MAG: efflux RND transporter permease subunit, partial [Fusobacteriaceae bacterium]|nr:efflux RND transporter permease subunit [Fusobacteriaceae bacterium]